MVESKYWVWTARETAELALETLGPAGADQVLIRTRYTGVSPGTEMALYMMTHVGFPDPANRYAKYPHRGGYLNVGIIEQAGADVADQWPAGTWVFSSAGHCQYSLARPAGDEWSSCYVLPETLHRPEACFLGMARISYTSPYLAPAGLGEKVAVLGAGLVGNFAAQLYNAQGADVLVVEKDAFRRGIAEKCGLKSVASTGEVAGFFGTAPRLVVEATGVPALCVEAFEMAAEGGRVVILSSPRGQAPVNFYKHIHAKVITVIGAHGKALAEKHAAARLMIEMAENGRLRLAPCLTQVEPWREAPATWNTYARGAADRLGTVFDWGG
jgi:threonine dehydrogenase-like Zn-dependent dehydrogenase